MVTYGGFDSTTTTTNNNNNNKYVDYDHMWECTGSPEKILFEVTLTLRKPQPKSSSVSSKLWNISRSYRMCLVIDLYTGNVRHTTQVLFLDFCM